MFERNKKIEEINRKIKQNKLELKQLLNEKKMAQLEARMNKTAKVATKIASKTPEGKALKKVTKKLPIDKLKSFAQELMSDDKK